MSSLSMSCFASHDRLAVPLPHTPPDLASVNDSTSPFTQRQAQSLSASASSSEFVSSSRPLSRPPPPPPPSSSLFATAYRPGQRPPPLLPTASLPAPKRNTPQAPPSSGTAASPPSSSSTSSAVLFRDVTWSKCYEKQQPSHTNHHPKALQPPISPPMSSHDHPPSPLLSAEPPQVARAHIHAQQQPMRSSSTNHNGLTPSSSSSSSTDTVALAAAAAAVAARADMASSTSGASSSGGSTSHNYNDRYPHLHQNHTQHRQPQKQHQQLPSLSSLFGPSSSSERPPTTPLLLLPSPLPPTYAPQSRQPQAYQQQQPQSQPQPQSYNHCHPRHDAMGPSEHSASSGQLERRPDTGLQHVAPSTVRWYPTAQKQAGSSSYAPSAPATASTPTHAASGRRRGSSSSSINGRPPLTPPLPSSTTATETAPSASVSSSSSGLPRTDGLGPKIWTGTQFLPRFVRTAEVPGEGLCYFYDDGSYCKTIIDGEAVNAHWGVTKAGKPRKRLAIACVLCREKKVKCDPDFPRCVQCQKFGRPCRFKNAPRGHNAVSPGATTPVWPAEDDSSVRTVQPQPQQQREFNHDHDRDQTSKRIRTGYDHYKETGGGGGGSSASSRSSPTAMSTATVDSARPGSARSVPALPPVSWAGQQQVQPQAQQHPSPQSSYTHAAAAAAAGVDASYPPSSASSVSAAASSAPSYGAAHYRPPYPLSPVPSQPTIMDQQPRHLPSDLPRYHAPPPRSQPTTDRPRLQEEVLRRPW